MVPRKGTAYLELLVEFTKSRVSGQVTEESSEVPVSFRGTEQSSETRERGSSLHHLPFPLGLSWPGLMQVFRAWFIEDPVPQPHCRCPA